MSHNHVSININFDDFKKVLIENGADNFTDSFIENLMRLIKHMKPAKNENKTSSNGKLERISDALPCLALPDNEPPDRETEDGGNVDDMMAFFESKAP